MDITGLIMVEGRQATYQLTGVSLENGNIVLDALFMFPEGDVLQRRFISDEISESVARDAEQSGQTIRQCVNYYHNLCQQIKHPPDMNKAIH